MFCEFQLLNMPRFCFVDSIFSVVIIANECEKNFKNHLQCRLSEEKKPFNGDMVNVKKILYSNNSVHDTIQLVWYKYDFINQNKKTRFLFHYFNYITRKKREFIQFCNQSIFNTHKIERIIISCQIQFFVSYKDTRIYTDWKWIQMIIYPIRIKKNYFQTEKRTNKQKKSNNSCVLSHSI